MAKKNDSDRKPETPVGKPVSPPSPAPGAGRQPSGSGMLQWFFSKTVRQATAMRKHVRKLLNHQRDLLSPKALNEVEAAMREVHDAVAARVSKDVLEKKME